MEHSYEKPVGTLQNCYGANWNQSSHIKKGILILKRNTHQKWNTPIIIKKKKKNGTLIKHGTH